MKTLNIYIYGDDSCCLFPLLDYVKNSKQDDVSLFFLKKKYPNPPVHENIKIFDFPEVITPQWFSTLCNFAQKIGAGAVRIHSAIDHSEKIIFPLVKAFQPQAMAGMVISLFLYETSFNDIILRQEYNKLLNDGFKPQPYIKKLKQKLLSDSSDWDIIYNYLFSSVVNTQYFISDAYKSHNAQFTSATHFRYLNDFFCIENNETVNGVLSALGVDYTIIHTIRDVCLDKKTLFYVDDGLNHPLGSMSKDECLLDEVRNNNYECVFLINYKGALGNITTPGVDFICLPQSMTLEALWLAGVKPTDVYGFCSLDLFYVSKKSVKKIFFHEHKGYADNKILKSYLDNTKYKDTPVLFVEEAQKRLANSSTTKQIFILAESMGDVLFAAGGLNALRDKLAGRFVCILPKIYHPLLSLCPWADELWEPKELNNEQLEELYIAQIAGNLHSPCDLQHIIARKHQIDSFLDFSGYKNTVDSRKEIVLSLDGLDKTNVDNFLTQNKLTDKIVLIHPNVGVPNRTWPRQSWEELIEKFLKDGWSVVLIGSNNNFYSHKKAVEIENSRVFNAVDKFTMAETIYMMTKASLLVACDSGPVALAAATDIAICALYSVVPGRYRLPYRHGVAGWNALAVDRSCKYSHCANMYSHESGETFDAWCPNNKLYTCVNQYPSDDFYREISRFLNSGRFVDQLSNEQQKSEQLA